MVIEHVFVTTLEPGDALRTAAQLLMDHGFVNAQPVAFQLAQTDWNCLEMRRGKDKFSSAMPVIDRPHSVRLEYDRGRVVVAASIDARRRSFWTGTGKEPAPASRNAADYVALLTAIVQALELLLAQHKPPHEAAAPLATLDATLQEKGQQQRRRSNILLCVAIAFVVAVFALLIFAVTGTRHR